MLSRIKIEEYMEFELFGVFQVKPVTKNMVLMSPVTHFIHLRIKLDLVILVYF